MRKNQLLRILIIYIHRLVLRVMQMDIATTLLEYGAKANAESKAGFTPLHLSAQEGHTDMSTLLIEHKADTNHKAKVRTYCTLNC